jgi:hypothetical protein
MRKSRWSRRVFDMVHWNAHERAFCRLPRYSQHSTAKLIHGLVNTNKQNHMYYGQSFLCPICHAVEESVDHVFTCSHPDASQHRQKCLDDLQRTLQHHLTPSPIIDAIIYGFSIQHRDTQEVRALTAGSLRGPDAVLTSAFHEQYCDLGWSSMCLRCISRRWASAVTQYSDASSVSDAGIQWSSLLIAALWKFSHALWQYRSTVVHGATVAEQAKQKMDQMRAQITDYYTAFSENNTIILPCHKFLFHTRSLKERLQASYDTQAAWIRSVEEAINVIRHHDNNLREVSQVFFPAINQSDTVLLDSESDSTYTYQSLGSEDILSLDPTEATTNTMSLVALSTSVIIHPIYDRDDDSLCSEDCLSFDSQPNLHVDSLPNDAFTPSSLVVHLSTLAVHSSADLGSHDSTIDFSSDTSSIDWSVQ